jgi:DNA-binding transcriptional MerR regulator
VSGANAAVAPESRASDHDCGPVEGSPPAWSEDDQELRIGELARRAGVSVRSLRYYEQQGLLGSERTAGGQRVYPPSAVERVRYIQQLYAAGVPSRVIVDLLPCLTTGIATTSMLALMEHERDAIADRLRELTAAHDRLVRVIADVRQAGVAPDDAVRASA